MTIPDHMRHKHHVRQNTRAESHDIILSDQLILACTS